MAQKQSLTTYDYAVSVEGFNFDPISLRWRLSRYVIVNLRWAENELSANLMDAYLSVLRYYAESASASYTSNLNYLFKVFVQFCTQENTPLEFIDTTHLINYRASLESHNEYLLGNVRGFFRTWVEQGRFGIAPEVVDLLNEWRLKSGQKGRAIKTFCPYDGALSDLEYQTLQEALIDAFEQKQLGIEDFVLVKLFMATGRRPAQISDLKIADFVEAKSSDGLSEFVLQVPRCKQRGVRWREEFHSFALTPELGALIKALIQETQRRFKLNFGSCSALDQLAIFPSWKRLEEYRSDDSGFYGALSDQWFHRNPTSLSSRLKEAVAGLRIHSERTGDYLKVYPTRLRRTMATRAAREGYGSLVIAEILDHSDTQNAFVYTENVPEHIERIDRAMAGQLATIAQAFAGVLVDQESDAERGDELDSRIRSSESRNGVGTCGHYGFCGAFAPIACYTCRHFQPWLDGPHEEVLDNLIAERERIKSKTNDLEMAAVNDRTIYAVQQVVHLCEERQRERKEPSDG